MIVTQTIEFVRLVDHAILPTKAHHDDACFDLYSSEDIVILPGRTQSIGTGFNIALPRGHVGLVCSRSGLAAKHCVHILNAPGVIDAGYRGEMKVILHNAGNRPFDVFKGDRVGQLLLQKVLSAEVVEVERFEEDGTTRGEKGFGSTGR